MVSVVQRGIYQLNETKGQTKMLILDGKNCYAWVYAEGREEIRVSSYRQHSTHYLLGMGNYRLYKVENEDKLSDQMHLELGVGRGGWQGYVLPYGLPTEKKKRNRIIPTDELITIR